MAIQPPQDVYPCEDGPRPSLAKVALNLSNRQHLHFFAVVTKSAHGKEAFCDRHGIDTRCHVQHVGERIG